MTKKESLRVLTFDLMRGYFLVSILLDHLFFFPNGFDWWSARGNLYVTAAEGFFFISGIVLGIVRGAKLIDRPFREGALLLLKRGVQLYVVSIVLVIIFTLLGWSFFMGDPGLKAGILPATTNFFDMLWQTLTLQYRYGWADYLRLYAVFLLVSPLVLLLLRKGKWYVVALLSILVWLFFPDDPKISDATQESYQLLSWQLVFFSGMIIGFHWQQIAAWWKKLPTKLTRMIVWSVIFAAVVTVIINVIMAFPQYFDIRILGLEHDAHYKWYVTYFDKERLPLARLALFGLWFWAAFALFSKFEKQILKYLDWILIPFGTNSLYVYTVHAFIIFFVHLWLLPSNILGNFLVTIAIIGIIRLMIHYKFLMRIIPR